MKKLISGDFNIDEVCGQLKLDEKIKLISGKDFWHIAGVPRLGIPSARTSDGPTGLRGTKWFNSYPSSCFPCGTALAATWNKSLLERGGKLMAEEAKVKGVHVVLGPTCNIQRSPLGGRGFESFSEDPVLSGNSASAIIRGIQDGTHVIATIKHFVCNDQEDERKGINVNVTERALREIYLKPFQIAIRDANPNALMTSYNRINGEHVSQSRTFIHDILRKEWEYDGTTMSDWLGTYSVAEGIINGLDIEMPGPAIFRTVPLISHQVGSREFLIDHLDDRVKSVLKLIKKTMKSGIPYDYPEGTNNSEESRKTLRELATQSIVLLKNDRSMLPLSKDEKIAVIGPLAKFASVSGGGSAQLNASYTTTPFDSIAQYLGKEPQYTLGSTVYKNVEPLGRQLTLDDGLVGFLAEFYLESPESEQRRPFDSYHLTDSEIILYDYDHPKLKGGALYYIKFLGWFMTQEPGVYEFGLICLGTAQLFVDDELVVDNTENQILGESFFGNGTIEKKGEIKLAGNRKYKIRIEFGSAPTNTIQNPKKSTFGNGGGVIFGGQFKRDPLIEISRAAELAKQADKAIVIVGLSPEWESEGFDRKHMDLPPYTDDLILAVVNANPNVIVVNHSGTPVTMPWMDKVPSILQAWYLGNEAGNAVSDILFGISNPSGKLSLSFPKCLKDNPSYLNFGSMKGEVLYGEDIFVGYRFYEKMERAVAFPFGHGLSYTNFKIKPRKLEVNEKLNLIELEVEVENVGDFDGAEVVQLYISPLEPTIIRPVKELVGFDKIFLTSGASARVTLQVTLNHAVSYFDTYKQKWARESGTYRALIGTSSENIIADIEFSISETVIWKGL